MSIEGFTGFGDGAQEFFQELKEHNSKEWFHANKRRYEEEVLEPAADFVLDLGPRLKEPYPDINFGTQRNGSGSIMRINRDIRFSPDKRPYKENLGIVFWIGGGKKVELPCFYFHLDSKEIFFYGGQHMFPKDVLERYREAVDDEHRGTELENILAGLDTGGFKRMEEPEYKRVPRGFPADHPREELLRLKGLGVSIDIAGKDALSGRLVEVCADFSREVKPLLDWILRLN